MNQKSFAIMIVVLAVLGGAYYLTSKPDQGATAGPGAADTPPTVASFFENTKPEDLDAIEIVSPDKKTVELRRDGKEWKLKLGEKLFALEENRAKGVLTSRDGKEEIVQGLHGSFQASNPANHANFHLDEASANHVRFMSKGKNVEDLLLGKPGPSGGGIFARRAGKNDVYLLAADLSDNFTGGRAANWRPTQIFTDLKKEDISYIKVDDRESTRTFELERRPATASGLPAEWRVHAAGKHAKAKDTYTESAASGLATLRARDFLAPDEYKAQKGEISGVVEFNAKDTTTTLTFYKNTTDARSYILERSGSDEPVSVFKVYAVFRDPTEFMDLPPTPTPTPLPTLKFHIPTPKDGDTSPTKIAPDATMPVAPPDKQAEVMEKLDQPETKRP